MNTTWLVLLGISLANNLDNTGVGIAYGVARIRIHPLANLWIAVIAFVLTGAAVVFGGSLSHVLPGRVGSGMSAFILCAIGLWVMLPFFRKSVGADSPAKAHAAGSDKDAPKGAWAAVRRILADPREADRDRSRHIDFFEASLLGVALSINNVGGGVSAGLLHLSALWTAFWSAVISFVVIWLGSLASGHTLGRRLDRVGSLAAGLLLIAIGVYELR